MDKPRVSDAQISRFLRFLIDFEAGVTDYPGRIERENLYRDLLDARRRIAELEKDAERYRAIRAGKWAIRQVQAIVQIDAGNYAYPLGTGGDLDSAVDTAIAAQRQKEGE